MLSLQRLAAAKLWIISEPVASGAQETPRDLPYLAHALYALIPVASDEVARISVDEWWRIYINPGWLDTAGIPEIGAELVHMTWHLLADHTARARDQDVDRSRARAWGRAADATVSHTLAHDDLAPDGLTTAAELAAPAGLSAEEYYARLCGLPVTEARAGDAVEPHEGCGSGADGIPRRHEHGPDADIGAVSAFDAGEIRRLVAIDYRDHARRRGMLPGDALRWVRQTLEPRMPWRALLTGAVRRAIGWAAGRGDYTYSRPSRRTSGLPGVVLPGQRRPVPRLSIVVDTSASVDDELLARALAEIDGAIAALGVPGANVTVYSVDAAVHTVARIRKARDARLVGAGGTDLRQGLRAATDERPRPDVIVVLTDGDTPWPQDPPARSAVIVALLGRDRAALPRTPDWAARVECVV